MMKIMMIKNEKGVVHLFAMAAIGFIIIIGLYIASGKNAPGSQAPDKEQESESNTDNSIGSLERLINSTDVETIRQFSYSAIDVQSKILKAKVDLALIVWGTLSREQKAAILNYLTKDMQNGLKKLDINPQKILKGGS